MSPLGEGNTPTVQSPNDDGLYFKLESLNPSGSFKDRGSADIVEEAIGTGTEELHIVSSGSAALSLALYCKAHNLECVCHLPDTTPEEKKDLIKSFGAELEIYSGSYEEIYGKLEDMEIDGANVTPGVSDVMIQSYTRIAEEILSSGIEPDNVVIPCGNGSGLAGIWKGFAAAGHSPEMIGVQVEGAAPIKKAIEQGKKDAVVENPTSSIAEGINASKSYHCEEAVTAIKESGGSVETVTGEEIEAGIEGLISDGVVAEPTSAVVKTVADKLDGVTVAIITGSGLKYVKHLKEQSGDS